MVRLLVCYSYLGVIPVATVMCSSIWAGMSGLLAGARGLSSVRRLGWASSQPGGLGAPREHRWKLQVLLRLSLQSGAASLLPHSTGQSKS